LLRGSAVGVVVATFIAAGLVGATAIRAKVDDASANRSAKAADSSRRAATRNAATRTAVDTTETPAASTPIAPSGAAPQRSAATPAPVATKTIVAPRAAPPLVPVLPIGRSELADSVTVIRGDSEVVVSFDLMMTRTRRAEKFEQFVRSTLPAIYGRGARDILSRIPDGALSGQGELLTELPKRGMRIPVGTDWMIRLYPETRQGQDGPLVVRYRVSVVPSAN
jgi:hypothetical protein